MQRGLDRQTHLEAQLCSQHGPQAGQPPSPSLHTGGAAPPLQDCAVGPTRW